MQYCKIKKEISNQEEDDSKLPTFVPADMSWTLLQNRKKVLSKKIRKTIHELSLSHCYNIQLHGKKKTKNKKHTHTHTQSYNTVSPKGKRLPYLKP